MAARSAAAEHLATATERGLPMRKAIVLVLAVLTLLAVAGGVPQSGFAKECDPSGTWC
jgi:hypothetical protein